MAVTSKSLQEIRAIRDRWAAMPVEEAEAEKKKLAASAKRRLARIKKQKATPVAPVPALRKHPAKSVAAKRVGRARRPAAEAVL